MSDRQTMTDSTPAGGTLSRRVGIAKILGIVVLVPYLLLTVLVLAKIDTLTTLDERLEGDAHAAVVRSEWLLDISQQRPRWAVERFGLV